MALAIFGIDNGGLNLVVNLLILMLVVVWLALIVYTYLDAKRRISDPFLVGCATLASFIPYMGTAVYAIVRPPEFLEDAHERELEIEAAELRVRQLKEVSCPGCGFPTEKSYLRCPQCQRRLKDPCQACGKPVDPTWALCPHCETPLGERPRRRPEGERISREEGKPAGRRRPVPEERRKPAPAAEERRKPVAREERKAPRRKAEPTKQEPPAKREPESDAPKQTASPKRPQRSPSREPDPDPRQA